MMGKVLVSIIVGSALLAGGAIYYLQVYAYFFDLPADTVMRMTPLGQDRAEPILTEDFRGIDANSSPLRFRACFRTPQSLAMMTETYTPYENARPLIGPGWFDCFDAARIGADLESGKALAFLGEANVTYGIDQVIAVYDDGRAYAWHQLNHCGEVVYDGQPAPEGCPPPPERKK